MENSEKIGLERLAEWASGKPERHFLLRKAGTFKNSTWRVAVWAKPEGENMGHAGEAVGADLISVVLAAVGAWETRAPAPAFGFDGKSPSAWHYAPPLLSSDRAR